MRENEDAARVFMKVRRQTVDRLHIEAGMGGAVAYSKPVDLNHLAVWAMIDALGIKDRLGTFDKVNRIFHRLLEERED